MYNHDLIDRAQTMARRVRRVCREIARARCPYSIPDKILNGICTRRKLYNFLDALDLPADEIRSIFHASDLPVPRDRSLKPRNIKTEQLPQWMQDLNNPNRPIASDNTDWLDLF